MKKYDFEITGDIGWGFGSKDYVKMRLRDFRDKRPCEVRVNSLGGSVDDALDIVARFREHGDVTCHMRGMNASAATILAMGAKKITMESSGLMLIHNCSSFVWELGYMNADELKDAISRLKEQKDNQDKIDRVVASLYAERCKKSPEELKKVMDRGGWLLAEECLELGLIDEIENDQQGVAKAISARYENYENLKLAYNLPDKLPDLTFKQQLQVQASKFNQTMKKFLTSILALFAITQTIDETNESQIDDVLAQIEDKHKKMVNDLEKKTQEVTDRDNTIAQHVATIAERDTTIQQHVATIAERDATIQHHVATIAERDASIAELNAQIDTLKKQPGATDGEPTGGTAQPQNKETSAYDLYNKIQHLL